MIVFRKGYFTHEKKTTLILEFNSDNPSLDTILDLKEKALKALLELKVLKKYICKKLQAL